MSIGIGQNAEIDRLVMLVLGDLGLAPDRPAESVQPAAPLPLKTPEPISTPAPESKTAAEPKNTPEPAEVTEIRLSGRVITLETIKKTSFGPAALRRPTRVIVPAGAVVTPLARDEFKKRHLEMIFEVGGTRPSAESAAKPASLNASLGNSLFTPSVPRKNEVQNDLFLAFHRLSSETIPKTLLESFQSIHRVEIFRNSCIIETTFALEEFLETRPEGKGIVLTEFPGLSAAILNRRRSIRALVGYEPKRFEEESAALGANTLTLDPKRIGLFGLRKMLQFFAGSEPLDCPAALRKGLES